MKFGRETEMGCLGGCAGGANAGSHGARIAPHPVVALHAPLGRQAVVVPPHWVEHGLPTHPLETRDEVGVREGEHVADVERPADGRRRRVDREHFAAGTCDQS